VLSASRTTSALVIPSNSMLDRDVSGGGGATPPGKGEGGESGGGGRGGGSGVSLGLGGGCLGCLGGEGLGGGGGEGTSSLLFQPESAGASGSHGGRSYSVAS
jgi:hypothetical protein